MKDGLIDDPRRCNFDPSRDVPKCAGADSADCFTAPQIEALGKIYGGPHDSKGKRLFPGEAVGSEPMWPDNFIAPNKSVLPRSESQMKFAMLESATRLVLELRHVQLRYRSSAARQSPPRN